MQIRKIIPSAVKDKYITMKTNLNSFSNLETESLLFPALGIVYLTNSGFVAHICIFFIAGIL